MKLDRGIRRALRDWLLIKLAGASPIMINAHVRAPLIASWEGQKGGLIYHCIAHGETEFSGSNSGYYQEVGLKPELTYSKLDA